MTNSLGCSEQCLGGRLEDKLAVLESLGLWMELVNTGPKDLSTLDSYNVEVKKVQAYQLHELQWLNLEEKLREAAHEHVLDTIGIAEGLGADYVLTVPSYGFDVAERPREKCIENYKRISEETHLNILIEALSPKQTGFLPSLPEVSGLVKEIDRDNVGLAADTWHIEESGDDVVDTLSDLGSETSELHLRDTDSKPPGRGNMDFKAVLDASSPRLLCLEFDMNTKEELIGAVRHLRSLGLGV